MPAELLQLYRLKTSSFKNVNEGCKIKMVTRTEIRRERGVCHVMILANQGVVYAIRLAMVCSRCIERSSGAKWAKILLHYLLDY